MAVLMSVERQRALGPRPKQRTILRRAGHHVGGALTAQVPVDTQHPVRCGHDHVQIVADHCDRAAQRLANIFDAPIKCGGAGLIKALCGLVQQQQRRVFQKRAGDQHTLELPAA